MVLPNFKENLEKYAKLLVANGINVQPGHTLVLNIDVEQRELAHLIVKEAYALGAHEVIVQWGDDYSGKIPPCANGSLGQCARLQDCRDELLLGTQSQSSWCPFF